MFQFHLLEYTYLFLTFTGKCLLGLYYITMLVLKHIVLLITKDI